MSTLTRPWLAGVAGVAVALPWPAPAATPDVEALRAELAALRSDYQSRIDALEQRLAELEAAPATAPPPPAAMAGAPAAPAGGARAASFNPAVSVILSGTFSNLSEDPENYAIAGFFPGGEEIGPGERGFSLGESELTLSASVDPYFDAALTFALAGEGEVEVEEAFARTTALPAGLALKAGRFFSGVGYLNERHAHTWDFADPPLAYQALLGGQLAQDGVQLRWVAPTPLFLELGAEAGNGDAYPGTRSDGNDVGTWALFAHVGGDLGESVGWRAGLSWLDAEAAGRSYEDADAAGNDVVNAYDGPSRTWIADLTLKWAPGGDARRRSLELQAEYLRREEDGTLTFDLDGAALAGRFRSRQDAWYAQAVYRFAPRWRAGLRYDALDSGDPRLGLVRDGTLARDDFPLLAPATPSRVTLMADWSPSEFSRLRAQYAWDDARDTGDEDAQWLLQYIHAIGAHGAHKF